jgi:hypothetical protein
MKIPNETTGWKTIIYNSIQGDKLKIIKSNNETSNY